jgi:hypothetical protein
MHAAHIVTRQDSKPDPFPDCFILHVSMLDIYKDDETTGRKWMDKVSNLWPVIRDLARCKFEHPTFTWKTLECLNDWLMMKCDGDENQRLRLGLADVVMLLTKTSKNERTAPDLTAYYADLRAFEDECYAATEGRSVIGLSCWNVGRILTRLREIDARHGVQRDDPRVYSIAAYRREREAIRGELDNLRLQAAANTDDESLRALWWRCEVRLTDCSARHFPGLNLLDGESVDSIAKLWAYIGLGIEQSELAERVAGPSVHQKTLREVYEAMLRLRVDWADPPPYGSFPDDQLEGKLRYIANRLEREERTEAAPAAKIEPLSRPTAARSSPARC